MWVLAWFLWVLLLCSSRFGADTCNKGFLTNFLIWLRINIFSKVRQYKIILGAILLCISRYGAQFHPVKKVRFLLIVLF